MKVEKLKYNNIKNTKYNFVDKLKNKNNNDKLGSNIITNRGHSPENGVWKAVIMQAVLDLMSNSKRSSEILAKKSAREWLNRKNQNFLTVCSYANLDCDWVLKKIQFALQNPRTWRRECDLKNFFKNKNDVTM